MKHVICIGVNYTKGLTSLTAAVSGAQDFEKWAKSQNYSTTLFVDSETTKVTQSQIFDEIYRIIDERTCEKLLIFFSGHGILKSPNQELWLLSDARSNPNEAINLTGSIDNSRTSGIPYIVFISDACRVLPNEIQLTGNGSVIFPIINDEENKTWIDIFYATRPGNPANEYSSTKNPNKFGLFTQSLVEILEGQYPEIISGQNTPNSTVPLTSYFNQELKHHYQGLQISEFTIKSTDIENTLTSLVKQKAKRINISLQQNPDLIIQYQNPKPYLSIFDANKAKNILLNNIENKLERKHDSDPIKIVKDSIQFGLPKFNSDNQSFKEILNEITPFDINKKEKPIVKNILRNTEKIFESNGRGSFETHTGFTVIGASIEDIIIYGEEREIFGDNDSTHIRISNPGSSTTALILLKNGQSIPIAILNEFIGTLIFEKNKLLTINYTPSQNSDKYYSFIKNKKEIDFVRAFIASAANEGFNYEQTFANEFNDEGHFRHENAGSFLRRDKSLDPSLGLYAVYAFIQSGNFKDIKSVYRYMERERENILFDVAMLAGKLEPNNNKISCFCPMLSLGWAYRNKFEDYIHQDITEAANYLVPGLWTTFEKKGTEILKNLIKYTPIYENNLYTR